VNLRSVARVVQGQATSDGAGVRLKRTLGSAALDHLDPFLLLDEFKSDDSADYIAGFPDHPHRGFETVTYMLAGAMEHRDHEGNAGRLGPGSAQWMTAGRGIIHSEMPKQEQGLMWGFQLWVNLPASDKMCEPRYQDIAPERIPELTTDSGAKIRIVAGEFDATPGAVTGIVTSPLYLDVSIPEGATFETAIDPAHNACAYVFEGHGEIGGDDATIESGQLAVLGEGDGFTARAGAESMRLLLLAARPIGEPVARYGPFVMNTREEIEQAFADFQSGQF